MRKLKYLIGLGLALGMTACSSSAPSAAQTETPAASEAAAVAVPDSQLYRDLFEPFTDRFGKLKAEEFFKEEKLTEYEYEYHKGNQNEGRYYKIYSDDRSESVTVVFYPSNPDAAYEDLEWTLESLDYRKGEESISMSDEHHTVEKPEVKRNDDSAKEPEETAAPEETEEPGEEAESPSEETPAPEEDTEPSEDETPEEQTQTDDTGDSTDVELPWIDD